MELDTLAELATVTAPALVLAAAVAVIVIVAVALAASVPSEQETVVSQLPWLVWTATPVSEAGVDRVADRHVLSRGRPRVLHVEGVGDRPAVEDARRDRRSWRSTRPPGRSPRRRRSRWPAAIPRRTLSRCSSPSPGRDPGRSRRRRSSGSWRPPRARRCGCRSGSARRSSSPTRSPLAFASAVNEPAGNGSVTVTVDPSVAKFPTLDTASANVVA